MTPFIAELIGTAVLILLGGGVCANVSLKKTLGNGSGWIVIATGWALAVFAGVVIAGPVSGAHLNPAVTIGLAVAGKFDWNQVPSFILAQFLGAFLGAFCVWLMHKDHFDATDDNPGAQLGVFCTGPAIKNTFLNIISEVLGTFVLVYCVFHFTDPKMTSTSGENVIGMGSIGAIPVTFIVWAIGLSLGGTTGYAINPARDLGPRIMHAILPMKGKGSSNWGYAWIPVIGPILGALLAAFIYLKFK
ncbi:MIP/aquaporin family protein [Rhizosphaericola mali]|uniref:Aquaporin family protein n=1 Tax=Rhizosphaericola mali TaxID=2545455 RepID=A0A5P2G9V0_9BACT|nr:MIP/aquaporin family protein [Rhizosphaericola mali]QES90480.1 aquaporin family protein [Rhizosphaericola mali]